MTDKSLYEAEVADLKKKHRRKRLLISSTHITLEMAFLLVLFYIFGLQMIIVYIVVATFFLPSPFFLVPSTYKIMGNGVIHFEDLPFRKSSKPRLFAFKSDHKLRIKEEEMHVSILHRHRGEALRLYTREPEKVYKILQKIYSDLT